MDCKSIQRSSSSRIAWKYDVFVSFRGEDTRKNFTDHLFGALHRKGIVTFRDDTNIKSGKLISSELLQANGESQMLIVVFSKNYASSTWCLQELAKIVDYIEAPGQSVLPIFYDVNPSEVRRQSGNYEKAFVKHEERFKENLEMMTQVQRWRVALTKVANLSGWDIQDKHQYAEIEKIVEKVVTILGYKSLSLPNDLVGMHSRVEQLEKLLLLGPNDVVRVVGICGMGGIGKTTLATTSYERISHQYDACCFIDDVSKIYEDYGPIGVPKQLLHQTLNEEKLQICNLSEATYSIRTRLRHLRALIVLDNVDQVEQLEKLALNRECLGAGSRIIIISRDKHILSEHGVDEIYNVQLLNKDEALELFCIKAFKAVDIMKDYNELAYHVLDYANGHPLAIKVLGSFLSGRDVLEWRSALARLRENPRKDIMDVFRISFDGLEDMEKEIFLDIACFFYYRDETYVKQVLDFRGFFPDIGIKVLIDKSLITNEKGWITMHDLLKELGRSIVREISPKEPRKWSRLWRYEDLHQVMLDNKAAENLEAIVLQQYEYAVKIREETIRADALSQMSNLKLLMLWNVNFSGSLNYLSNELGYLSWEKYPFTCLPSSFEPNKLVELILPHSNIQQLWEGTKPLHNLRRMDLSHSENLVKLPDFREVRNLEWLHLEGCIKLVQIDPSIGLLRKLADLNLTNCKNLVSIPSNILDLSSLLKLNLSGCSKLLNNQILGKRQHVEQLRILDTNETDGQCQSTFSISKMLRLPFHFFYSGRQEDSGCLLLPSLPRFPCLQHLDLSFCNLLQIPDAIGWLHCLEDLNLGGNNFVRLPSSIKELSKLRYLNLEHCKQLKYLPELPSRLVLPERRGHFNGGYRTSLYIFDCPNLGEKEGCTSMAFSWMIKVLRLWPSSFIPPSSSGGFRLIDIVIPGTQIPRWFKNQSVGSSISTDPSLIMHDSNWIGVACCGVFVALDDPTTLNNQGKSLIAFGFQNKGGGCFPHIGINLRKNLVTVELDHLLLVYFTREEFFHIVSRIIKGVHDLDGVEFSFLIDSTEGLRFEVKNCAYRWVFKQDLEQLNPTMTHSESSIIQIDDDLREGDPFFSSEAGSSSVQKGKF